jgi:hypothetical protein
MINDDRPGLRLSISQKAKMQNSRLLVQHPPLSLVNVGRFMCTSRLAGMLR